LIKKKRVTVKTFLFYRYLFALNYLLISNLINAPGKLYKVKNLKRDMIKRVNVFLGVFFIFAITFVSAQVCLTDEDTIFKISEETNAHGQVATYYPGPGIPTYQTGICFSDIFSGDISSIPEIRNCTGSNLVTILSALTNAQGKSIGPLGDTLPDVPPYTIPVCYKGLTSCVEEVETVLGEGCSDPNKEIILRMSSLTNAHFELANPSSNPSYDRIVCCESGKMGEKEEYTLLILLLKQIRYT
jgi:hypothetical protein